MYLHSEVFCQKKKKKEQVIDKVKIESVAVAEIVKTGLAESQGCNDGNGRGFVQAAKTEF